VVASRHSVFYGFVRESYGDALAVEMEGWGFLEAVRSHPDVRAVVIRGISDLIEDKSKADASGSQLQAARNASVFVFSMLGKYHPISQDSQHTPVWDIFKFQQNTKIEALLKDIGIGDWKSASDAAIRLIQRTQADGSNPVFDALLKYYDCPYDDLRWAAFQLVESTVALSPNMIDRNTLVYFSRHADFSIRASAASICMELANSSPVCVPVDILIPLSLYYEDWYVQAPANAALKTLTRSMPQILRIFINRLHSRDPLEREHAAGELADIARTEPELLDYQELRHETILLKQLDDKNALHQLEAILSKIKRAAHRRPYKYGL
jgi:hypothetical protein